MRAGGRGRVRGGGRTNDAVEDLVHVHLAHSLGSRAGCRLQLRRGLHWRLRWMLQLVLQGGVLRAVVEAFAFSLGESQQRLLVREHVEHVVDGDALVGQERGTEETQETTALSLHTRLTRRFRCKVCECFRVEVDGA